MAEKELNDLKSVLKALVTSTPSSSCTAKKLIAMYRAQENGKLLPIYQFGYKHVLPFLKDKCQDCFTFQGKPSNPLLKLIVPNDETEKPRSFSQQSRERKNVFRIFFNRRIPEFVSLNFPADPVERKEDYYEHKRLMRIVEFRKLKREIHQIVKDSGEPIWATRLMSSYRKRYKRDLNYAWYGYMSIASLLKNMKDVVSVSRPAELGDWLVRDATTMTEESEDVSATLSGLELESASGVVSPEPASTLFCAGRCRSPTPESPRPAFDLDEALPGIDFDPDVFPSECMQLGETIPSASLTELRPGHMISVKVGEVYSPSHFWLFRLGLDYDMAIKEIMDAMMAYYVSSEGQEQLAYGAVRVGHYCAAMLDGDWHRSVIVNVIDADYVKVRHVDNGIVSTVAAESLRPLRREYARLPTQAMRARLAGIRPSAAAQRWTHAASMEFLAFVRECQLEALVAAIKEDEMTLEVFLIDISTNVCMTRNMIRTSHAVVRTDCALWAEDCYLHPSFNALESGAIPNLYEIADHLQDDVETYWEYGSSCISTPERLPPGFLPLTSAQEVDIQCPQQDAESAQSGIDLDPDVFPSDCMQLGEVIPLVSLAEIHPGHMFAVKVSEVCTPSHFWFYRHDVDYDVAMEDIMGEMLAYFESSEGMERYLARGAVRVGHYCAALYSGDWHRAVILSVLNNFVKVRHVDYGTVTKVAIESLRPLRREWATLPAQAIRARLAGLRPAAEAQHWTLAASSQFLRCVSERPLMAQVTAIKEDEMTLEMFLIDTSTEEDVCMTRVLIRTGHAVARTDSALLADDFYLYPIFDAIESGASPNLEDIASCLQAGIDSENADRYLQYLLQQSNGRPSSPQPADLPSSPPPADRSTSAAEEEAGDSSPPVASRTAAARKARLARKRRFRVAKAARKRDQNIPPPPQSLF